MPHILQIYKTVASIEKPDYTPEIRKHIGAWTAIQSRIGNCNNHVLYLPIEYAQDASIQSAGLIIIQDSIGVETKQNNSEIVDSRSLFPLQNNTTGNILSPNIGVRGFKNHTWPWRFELFDFKIKEDKNVDIWFHYDDMIGIPQRDSHKIASLQSGQAIRYKVNGKSDFTLTGRKQRSFVECDYVIQYFGIIDRIEFVENHKTETTKSFPAQINRIIDERKILA